MKKRFISMLLVASMTLAAFVGCGSNDKPAESTGDVTNDEVKAEKPDWTTYDSLIDQIRTETDLAARVDLMHQAEDMMMATGCVIPIYYYVNQYVQSANVDGIYWTSTGMKYFQYASKKDGNTVFNACLASEPDYLDPQLNSSVDGGILAVNTFEGLTTIAPDRSVVGGQAESWTETANDDGTVTVEFTMRDGLKWSNGDTLDATDFVYSWNRAVAAETAADYAYLYDIIAKNADGSLMISASEDAKTFTVTLSAPCAYFLELCAFPALFPVYEESVVAGNKDGQTPGGWALEASSTFVCNGPFVLNAWEHESSMKYVKNPNYRDAENVNFTELNFMLTSDDSIAFSAFKTGDLDLSLLVPTAEIANLNGTPEYHVDPYLGTYYVAWNINSDIYAELGINDYADQVTFRNAITLLIDRDYIVEEIGQAGQVPANTFIPAGCADGNGGEFRANSSSYSFPVADETGYYSLSDYEANKAEAIEMLKSIGFEFNGDVLSDSTPIYFDYLVNTSTGNVAIGEAIQADLKSVGIEMTIVQEEWNVFLEDRKKGNYDFAREGWIMDYNDPINMLEMWTTESGNNDCQFGR